MRGVDVRDHGESIEGGCTVTLVERSKAEDLMECLQEKYKEAAHIDCACFETGACAGAREIGL